MGIGAPPFSGKAALRNSTEWQFALAGPSGRLGRFPHFIGDYREFVAPCVRRRRFSNADDIPTKVVGDFSHESLKWIPQLVFRFSGRQLRHFGSDRSGEILKGFKNGGHKRFPKM
jgi:hypothetical protein